MADGFKVFRGGVTTDHLTDEGGADADVGVIHYPGNPEKAKILTVSFFMASKGGGRSSIQIQIEPSAFGRLAASMFEVNETAAINAFSRAASNSKGSQSQ